MSNIASMMGDCVSPSLILLDEAGTGTDPEEGSALGVAIVDHFRRESGEHVIASPHYRGLKMYAANDESVINASVEFDERTLQPTYRLLLGLAGASSGIEIARRFGINEGVIEHARSGLDVSAQEAERYLAKLQDETRQAEDLRIALEEEREAVALKYASLEVEAIKKEKLRQKEFQGELASAVEEFDRQSKAFMKTIEDKALKNRLDKERLARKAELNRAVVTKLFTGETRRRGGSKATSSPPYEGGVAATSADGVVLSASARSTLHVLLKLRENGSISDETFAVLNEGYEFLTAVDHNMRLTVGRISRVPAANQHALEVNAERMNLASTNEICDQLALHRLSIREAFDSIVDL